MSEFSNPLLKPPCHGQTAEEVAAWLKANVAVGVTVVVRNTQGGFLHYAKGEVVRLGKGRFEVRIDPDHEGGLSDAGVSYYYSGKNCFHPKGKTRLVIPSPAVLQACGRPGDLGPGFSATTV